MKIKNFFSQFLRKYLFNPKWRCIVCGKEIFDDRFVCDKCESELPYIVGSKCGHCGRKVIAPEEYCSTCKNYIISIDKGRSVFSYEKPIDMLIKNAKYKNRRYLYEYFANKLALLYLQNYFNADYLLCVPMSEKTEKKRGFNHSKLLAQKLSEQINVPFLDAVKKVKETKRQATLKKKERIENIKDAFRITDKKTIKDKTVVIVDDVTTTGATAQVIAERLKRAGAKLVYLITVASTPPVDKY